MAEGTAEATVATRLVVGGIYHRVLADGVEEYATCSAVRVTTAGTREGFFARYPFKTTNSVREGEDSLASWKLVHDPIAVASRMEGSVKALKPRRGRPRKQS